MADQGDSRRVWISTETMELLSQVAQPFEYPQERQAGGWIVEFSDQTIQRMDKARLAGETDDQLVMRLTRNYLGRSVS